jgi:hypothetical protein
MREAKNAERARDRRKNPEGRNWKSENGNWQGYFPVSNFQFLVSLDAPQIVDFCHIFRLGCLFLQSKTTSFWDP